MRPWRLAKHACTRAHAAADTLSTTVDVVLVRVLARGGQPTTPARQSALVGEPAQSLQRLLRDGVLHLPQTDAVRRVQNRAHDAARRGLLLAARAAKPPVAPVAPQQGFRGQGSRSLR